MPTQIAVPSHFVAEFLTLVVCVGAAFESLRAGSARSRSLAFAAAEVATAMAAPGGGDWLVAAHALRAAAGLLLARWLWRSIVRSIRLRFVAAFIAGLVILVMVISTALTLVLARNLEREELDR